MIKNKKMHLPLANLPSVLQNGANAFKTRHEKLIFLYGAMVALSGICYRIRGQYRQQRVHPNLFLFVLAEFASGKSALNYARKLVEKIHSEVTSDSVKQLKLYQQTKKQGKAAGQNGSAKPPVRTVLIPANITSAKLIEHLSDNENTTPSIIVESEIDTLTVAAKSEHGNFSDVLRKGFHNEPISYSRKGNSEFLEINCPTFSIALAGTLNQFRKLITNSEDGLFSRFWVYRYTAPQHWSSVAPNESSVNLDEMFEKLASTVYAYYQFLQNCNTTILLTRKQWQRLDGFGINNLQRCKDKAGMNGAGIVKRHGLMLYKACLTLTAIRLAESNNEETSCFCRDDDFESALWLTQQSLDCSLDLLASLSDRVATGKRNKEDLIALLPLEFSRATAVGLGKQAGFPERTTDRYLDELVKSQQLIWVSKGNYKKV